MSISIQKHFEEKKTARCSALKMSFSFGFTQDNFSDDELIDAENQNSIAQVDVPQGVNPLDSSNKDAKPPIHEDFLKLLQSLMNIRVTFERYTTPSGQVVFRRELFDVKHQLMSEEGGENQDEEFGVLMGTDTTDLQKNVYEGGLKSWECSIDTVDKLSTLSDSEVFGQGDVVELGCGTSLPSTFLFQRALKTGTSNLKFKLSDYNPAVLRLVTLPNLVVSWASTLPQEQLLELQRSEDPEIPIVDDELQLTPALIQAFKETLDNKNISIELFSGAWNREFFNLITKDSKRIGLIITSETIYSPETLPIIGELLIELINESKSSTGNIPTALVAAKDIYFGVGGSLIDFENYLQNRIQQGTSIEFQTEKVKAGLQRSIVIIR